MFQDFDTQPAEGDDEEKKRKALSFGLATLLFGGIALALATAVATAHAVVNGERDIAVSFATLPAVAEEKAPPPPPPPPPPKQGKRSKAKKVVSGTPKAIPDEQPPESDDALADATDTGPIDGMVDGEGEGEGSAPPSPPPPPPPPAVAATEQKRETIGRPQYLSGCRSPEAPAALAKTAETIRIEIRFVVAPSGETTNATIVGEHPLVPAQPILDCIAAQRYEPARLPDGMAIPFPFRQIFIFRPAVI